MQFRGSSAKALARCDVQSGDYIDLTLSHVQWEKEGSASGTPGRGIEWELRFGERVILQVGSNVRMAETLLTWSLDTT